MANNPSGMSDQELALWMLEKMRDSEVFLGVLNAARTAGAPDVLDTPEYVARHRDRLKKLYQGEADEDTAVSAGTAASVDELVKRDLLSSREELIEKALAAYLDQHPKGRDGLPQDWQSTFELARAEIEGRTKGAFHSGFVAELAQAARTEMQRQAEAGKSRDRGRGRET